MSKSESIAPFIVRKIPPEQIERGQRLQREMEKRDALEAKKLADELKADDEARRIGQERAAIEEIRRSTSPAGRYMDAKYGWVNNTKG
ncbi:MAG: hypothetical protein M3R15_21560 [Acidobacteriota bacterium]|nr:hypothetical protein [Acidobacteriota bacterium]